MTTILMQIKKINSSLLLKIYLIFFSISNLYGQTNNNQPTETIFAFGGDINPKFIQYVIDLTNKPNPKICYLPTASADNANNIMYWEGICKQLLIQPYVLKVWVSSANTTNTFEEVLLTMDAIVVGGGNTLNMLGIWKAQGIDTVLKKALKKGIVLAGGSAGSLCWFKNGISDSRPVNLSVIEGLGFLPYSNCPHYTDSTKQLLYHQKIKRKEIDAGYACDNFSGVLFKNGEFIEAVSSKNETNNAYYISLNNNTIVTKKLENKILIDKNSIPNNAYTTIDVNKKVNDYAEINKQDTPLNAFISLKYIFANGKMSQLKQLSSKTIHNRLANNIPNEQVSESKRNRIANTQICKILIYNNVIAGVINKTSDDYYGLWFFYKEDGEWKNAGEDIGGETIYESELTFCEKIKLHSKKLEEITN